MEKEFVTYELALRLKTLGFNEPCIGFRNQDNSFLYFTTPDRNNTNTEFKFYPTAPTWQSAFRWFEEKYNIHGILKQIIGSKNGYDSFPILGWDYDIICLNQGSKNSYYMGYPIGEWFTGVLDRLDTEDDLSDFIDPKTKPQALQECLLNICEIIENRNK